MTSDDLVQCLEDAWKQGKCVVHNWKQNPFPREAIQIWAWCNRHVPPVNWGGPTGFRVQEAQRKERKKPKSRICAYQEPQGHQRLMFSLSSGPAFAAARAFAAANGFRLLP